MKFLKREFATNRQLQHSRKETKNLHNNKFKVVTTPDTATLEYYQSIYTHCKQRFNIPDRIEVVKKSVYQYIENCINNYLFGNYNILEVRSNLYNNLVHYSQLRTKDLNSKTLATYFQELNFNIIEYCKEKYPTTAKHLQTPEQGTSAKLPLSITSFPISLVQPQTPSLPLNRFSRPEDFHANIIDYLQENKSNHSDSLESKETEPEPEEITENKEEMATAYIAKIPEFTGKDNDTSAQEWLNKVQKAEDVNGWIAARMLKTIPYFLQGTAEKWFENLEEPFENWQAFKNAFLQQFTDNNISITLRNHFRNIKQETSETVMTYLGRFNKLLRQIQQLETNDYYSDAQILDQFIAGLKAKLIKKVCPHALADLATAIRHAKSYEMAMEEANHTKLVNLAIEETSSTAEEKIDQLTKKVESYFQINNNSNNNHKNINSHNNATKTILDHRPTTNLKIVIIMEFQDIGNKIVGNYKETNKTGVINITLYHNNSITNFHHQSIIHQDHKIKTTPPTQQYQVPARRLVQHNQFTPQNQLQKKSDFQQTALSKDKVVAPRSNPSNHIILPAQIAQNPNLSDIFLFEFEANKSPFLLSNAAVNEQKAITAMYTEATVEEKPIHLILNNGLAGNIITYQLMQQLK
ncbi:hypothetical protein G9A89_000743 [Geosiphon pyriformis]|nr:hypothetical protein G9A89_000743 [Geosiphon pyriformis]